MALCPATFSTHTPTQRQTHTPSALVLQPLKRITHLSSMIRLFLQTQLACRENAAQHTDLSNHNYYFRDECHTREKTPCQGSKLKDACSLPYMQFIMIGLLYNKHSDLYKRHVSLIIWTIATFCSKVSVSHDLWNGIQPSLFIFFIPLLLPTVNVRMSSVKKKVLLLQTLPQSWVHEQHPSATEDPSNGTSLSRDN